METRSKMKLFRVGTLCLLSCLIAVSAHAELFIFGQINGNQDGICPDAFLVDVVQQDDQALFTFTNNCDNGGVLGRIFVRENDLIIFNSIYDQSDDVSFSDQIKGNAMLPGGNKLGFSPHNTFGIFADPPRPHNGLHYGDFVSVLFDINTEDGIMFSNIIDSIDNGTLGLGLHVQAMPGGGSASFSVIPEPMTLTLLGIGTLLIRHKKRGTAQIG